MNLCKDEGYGEVPNMYQCRKVLGPLNRNSPSHSIPIRFAIASTLYFLPGCIYDRRGSQQLFWNKETRKHPDKNVQEWCSKHERCRKSSRICVSIGRK